MKMLQTIGIHQIIIITLVIIIIVIIDIIIMCLLVQYLYFCIWKYLFNIQYM